MSGALYPIFRRMDANVLPGLSAKSIARIACLLVAGALLFAASGNITKTEVAELGYAERAEARSALDAKAAALAYVELEGRIEAGELPREAASELSSIESYALSGLSEEEIYALAEEARSLGIAADASSAELEALIPETYEREAPLIPDAQRLLLCLSPALLAVGFLFEVGGCSLSGHLRQLVVFKRSKRAYFVRDGRIW